MATINDILTTPASGANYIDALLAVGPDWNFLTTDGIHFRNTLYYTFATDGTQYETRNLQPFNAQQQKAAMALINYASQVTGIHFEQTTSSAAADIHFASADIADPELGGVCYAPYSYMSNAFGQLTSYTADAYIYLDSQQTANQNPVAGTWGYQALLHEIGHALGLKHPFASTSGATTVLQAPYQDNTAHTVMSYTDAGSSCYSQFNEYDLAALNFLYGGDGLGGAWGGGTTGTYLTGTTTDSSITAPSGKALIVDPGGADSVSYSGSRKSYTIEPSKDKAWLHVSGPNTDQLVSRSIEKISFSDGAISTSSLLNPVDTVVFGTKGNELLTGTRGNDLLYAFFGTNTLLGNGGDDLLCGGSGLDTAQFDVKAKDAVIAKIDAATWIVTDSYGTASLTSIERVKFQDCKVALDLDPGQSAGEAALVVGAAIDSAHVSDPSLTGAAIGMLDNGMSLLQLCGAVTGSDWFKASTGGTDTGFVNLLYHNLFGTGPSAADQNTYLSQLVGHGGSMTQADMLASAALSMQNQTNINLAGLQQTGLAYL